LLLIGDSYCEGVGIPWEKTFAGILEKKLKPQPYYPNYSANLIANNHYRLMSLEERGLLWTMYNDYWVNHGLDPVTQYRRYI
jgi:hypothetical protein